MAAPARTVAVLIANPALGAILTMVLAGVPSLRVRPFDSQLALLTYMRLAPVDLLVTDFEGEGGPAGQAARAARSQAAAGRRGLQIIALASAIDRNTRAAANRAGIDEIIVKPMSPKYLLERVLARLRATARPRPEPNLYPGTSRLRYMSSPSDPKVVPLFGPRPAH